MFVTRPMVAFVGIVIIFIIDNYRYLLPIQYIECDMMVSLRQLIIIKVLWHLDISNLLYQLSLFYAQEAAA